MEKFKNNFEGFANIINDDSICELFAEALRNCNFGNKFSHERDYTGKLIKKDGKIYLEYTLTFDVNYELKQIDYDYAVAIIKEEIPFENVEHDNAGMNEENEAEFLRFHFKPKFRNTIVFRIPFTL